MQFENLGIIRVVEFVQLFYCSFLLQPRIKIDSLTSEKRSAMSKRILRRIELNDASV
jgi:hypothetical protein